MVPTQLAAVAAWGSKSLATERCWVPAEDVHTGLVVAGENGRSDIAESLAIVDETPIITPRLWEGWVRVQRP